MGGLPSALLIDRSGSILREIDSSQLPLGIDDLDPQQVAPEILQVPAGGAQLVMFSDGLIEAHDAADEEFGRARLASALASVPAERRIDAVKGAMLGHLGNLAPHDDVTLMLVDLPSPTVV